MAKKKKGSKIFAYIVALMFIIVGFFGLIGSTLFTWLFTALHVSILSSGGFAAMIIFFGMFAGGLYALYSVWHSK